MEQRKSTGSSWPWKKKSSHTPTRVAVAVASPNSQSVQSDDRQQQGTTTSQGQQQIVSESVHIHSQRSEAEEIIHNQLNEERSRHLSHVIDRNDLLRQHAKVAEEAVSGWQRAEVEVAAYRKQLDEALQQKAAMEDRAQQCMRQLRAMREEQEKTIEDALSTKSVELDELKTEMEAKLSEMENQLLESEAKNSVLLRSMQERSRALAEITEEKYKAEGEVRMLRSKTNAAEKENSRLKYEVHLLKKELEIRTDEREYSKRAAEISHKQRAEHMNKMRQLELECQRLREFVRVKLSAASAADSVILQEGMHYEGRGVVETGLLEEALGKGEGELHLARTVYARSTPNDSSNAEQGQIESAMRVVDQKRSSAIVKQKSSPTSLESHLEVLRSFNFDVESPNLVAPKAELDDGRADIDEVSCAESWASALIAELALFRKDKAKPSQMQDEKVINLSNLGMADYFTEIESVASCSEAKNEEKQHKPPIEINKPNDYKQFNTPGGITFPTEKRNENPQDIISSIKADGAVGSRFWISVTEIVQLVEALAHPLLYCSKVSPQDGNMRGKKANTTHCELINESDLQSHIQKLVEIKEKVVEIRSNVSWVVVDFLEELAGVLNGLLKTVLYRNAEKEGCNSDEDFDDTMSDMSGIDSSSNRQQQQIIRRGIHNNNAKGKCNLSSNNLPPSSLGHRLHYSLWNNNELDDEDDENSTAGFPFRGLEVSKSSAASKTQRQSRSANRDTDAQNEGKSNQDFVAKYEEIQKELKIVDKHRDLREDQADKSRNHSITGNEEGLTRKKMEEREATSDPKFHPMGRQSKALGCPLPSGTLSKDESSTSFMEKIAEKEKLTYMPKGLAKQHEPHPHPSLNSKHIITPHNHQASSSSKLFYFNSKFLKTAFHSTLSKSMRKSDVSFTSTPFPQKSKSSNKLLTRLLSFGHTS